MNSSIISVRRALAGAAAVLVVGLAAAAPSALDGGSSPGNLRAAGIPFVGTVIAGDFNYKEIRPSPAPAPALSSPHPLS